MESGTKLGHYEISTLLGKGGMGEVWRARDTKLGREVAIKTLPEEFAKDANRLARFEREAKLLASLNHPNIAAIHGFEEDNGTHFLVLELVEGDTLADSLNRGAIPIEESLKLALQIAEALEAAHERGVIHRDLKPANVKVTPDGKVKVLDFGLAKALAGDEANLDLSNSPTLSMAATQQGVILGTAAYMSPEQARGVEVDKRADIWAFGAVVFEMLTGQQAFRGELMSDVMASVLKSSPDYQGLPPTIHPKLTDVMRRCLEKDPKNRYRDIGDVSYELKQVEADPSGSSLEAHLEIVRAAPKSKLVWGAASILGIAVTALGVWNLKPPPTELPTRFTIPLSEQAGREIIEIGLPAVTVDPDGRAVVYVTENGLHRREFGQFEPQPIQATEEASMPFFSPDGQWLGFWAEGLGKVSLAGGFPENFLDVDVRGASWNSDDTILFGTPLSGLWRVSSDGGDPEQVTTTSDGAISHRWPDVLPNGEAASFVVQTGQPETGAQGRSEIGIVDLETGDYRLLSIEGTRPRYVSTGHIIFARGTSLWAVPFDLERLEVIGDPAPAGIDDVAAPSGTPQFAVRGGTLVYLSGTTDLTEQPRSLVWVNRNGGEQLLSMGERTFWWPRLSADGSRVVVQIAEGGSDRIWVGEIECGNLTPITAEQFGEESETPLWLPETDDIIYTGIRSNQRLTLRRSADGSGDEEVVPGDEHAHHHLTDISADGETLVWTEMASNQERLSMWTSQLSDDETSLAFLPNAVGAQSGVFSPDGRWLAYVSLESGEAAIYVASHPDGSDRRQIALGTEPMWSRDGNEIFYRDGQQMMALAVQTTNSFEVGTTTPLFQDKYMQVGPASGRGYDVDADGQLFLMLKPTDLTAAEGVSLPTPQINIVLNWFEELKERVPVP